MLNSCSSQLIQKSELMEGGVVVLRLIIEMGVGMERQDLSYGEGVHTRFTSSGPSRWK